MNNYEKIKSMSVDEMAECIYLLKVSDCGIDSFDECPSCKIYGLCQQIGKYNIQQWLLAETKEDSQMTEEKYQNGDISWNTYSGVFKAFDKDGNEINFPTEDTSYQVKLDVQGILNLYEENKRLKRT